MDAPDKITLKGMQFYVNSGVYPFEKEKGQPLEVDVICSLDLREAAREDDFEKTMDYEKIYEKIKKVISQKEYSIMEAICERIASNILEDPRIRKVEVSCRKPKVRLPGILDYAEVSIERKQENT